MIDITGASPRPSQEYRPGSAHSPLHWPRVTPASSKLVKIPKSVALFDTTFTTYHYTNSSSSHFQLMCFFSTHLYIKETSFWSKRRLQSFFRLQDAGSRYHIHHIRPWNSSQVEVEACLCQIIYQGWRGFKGWFLLGSFLSTLESSGFEVGLNAILSRWYV